MYVSFFSTLSSYFSPLSDSKHSLKSMITTEWPRPVLSSRTFGSYVPSKIQMGCGLQPTDQSAFRINLPEHMTLADITGCLSYNAESKLFCLRCKGKTGRNMIQLSQTYPMLSESSRDKRTYFSNSSCFL